MSQQANVKKLNLWNFKQNSTFDRNHASDHLECLETQCAEQLHLMEEHRQKTKLEFRLPHADPQISATTSDSPKPSTIVI